MISISNKSVLGTISEKDIEVLKPQALAAAETLEKGDGAGNDFLGWLHLPSEITAAELDDINATAQQLRQECDYVVVIGIGGSYLGAKAVIEALSDNFAAYKQGEGAKVVFAGNNIGEDYLYDLMRLLEGKRFGIVVISKSGTTTEPAIAFRLLKNMLEKQVGKAEAAKRIVAITDARRGALRSLATQEGYKTYVIADNVGGRFSVLTPVGLLPVAIAGFDIHADLRDGHLHRLKGVHERNAHRAHKAGNVGGDGNHVGKRHVVVATDKLAAQVNGRGFDNGSLVNEVSHLYASLSSPAVMYASKPAVV